MLTALIILEVALFIVLLLFLPIRVEAGGVFSLRTSRFWIRARIWGIIPVRLKFRLNLFSHPYFTLQQLKKNGDVNNTPLSSENGSSVELKKLFHQSQIKIKIIVGIKDDAALTVFSLGALHMIAETVTELIKIPAEVGEEAVFDKNVFRVKIFGITKVNLANIIHIFKKKRGKKHASR